MVHFGSPSRCLPALLMLAASGLHAAPRYTVTRLPPSTFTINNRGDAAGVLFNTPPYPRAFRWSQGNIEALGSLAGGGSRPYGINDRGQVVGESHAAPLDWGHTHAFLYSDGRMSDLGTLGGNNSMAAAINKHGQIAGTADTALGRQHAFLYSGGYMLDLGTLDGHASTAMDLNASGHVVGESGGHAFIWRNGLQDLGAPMGYSIARAINDAGQVVGLSGRSPIDGHAFLYADGEMTDLGTLGGSFSSAFDINNAGDIVGWTDVEGHDGRLAFLYSGGRMRTLDSLVCGDSSVSFGMAYAINDAGQVLASGCGEQACGAYLLTPIPEPAGWLMLAAGSGFVLMERSRRRRRHASRARPASDSDVAPGSGMLDTGA